MKMQIIEVSDLKIGELYVPIGTKIPYAVLEFIVDSSNGNSLTIKMLNCSNNEIVSLQGYRHDRILPWEKL